MKQIKFIQPQCEMVIVGVSIDLTTHADVPTRVRNAVVAHTRPSGAIAGGGCPGGHFVISSSNARAGAIAGKHAVPPRQKSRAGPYAVAPGRFAGAPKLVVWKCSCLGQKVIALSLHAIAPYRPLQYFGLHLFHLT